MLRLKEKRKSEIFFSVVLTVLLFCFLGLIFYINISCNPEYYDGDIYNDINYAKEAWKAKSLFPKNWIFGNQVYVVATPVLASLIYGLFGNAIMSMAAASCIMTVLIVITYYWMLRPLFGYNEITAGFLFIVGVLMLKAHVSTSQQGLQAFFTMASYYACYLINAFIVYGCYIRIRNKSFSYRHIALAIVGVLLSFGNGMQSLRQTAVMALPLIVCEILLTVIYSVKKRKFALSGSTVFSICVFAANIAGLVAVKFVELNQNSIYGSTELTMSVPLILKKLMYNVEFVVLTFGMDSLDLWPRLFAAVPFLLIVLFGFVLCFRDFIKKKCTENNSFILVILFAFGCLSVFAAGVLTNVANRALYFFMIYPLTSVEISYILLKFSKRKNIVTSIIIIFFVAIFSFRTVQCVNEIQAGKDENSDAHQIADYMMENGYKNLYSVFGLSGVQDGAENVVVASGDKIHLVQYKRLDGSYPMKPVEYLCVKDDFRNTDSSESLYIFRDYELPKAKELCEKYGAQMTVKADFGDSGALYAVSKNICALVDDEK